MNETIYEVKKCIDRYAKIYPNDSDLKDVNINDLEYFKKIRSNIMREGCRNVVTEIEYCEDSHGITMYKKTKVKVIQDNYQMIYFYDKMISKCSYYHGKNYYKMSTGKENIQFEWFDRELI